MSPQLDHVADTDSFRYFGHYDGIPELQDLMGRVLAQYDQYIAENMDELVRKSDEFRRQQSFLAKHGELLRDLITDYPWFEGLTPSSARSREAVLRAMRDYAESELSK